MKLKILFLILACCLPVDAHTQRRPGDGKMVGMLEIRGRLDETELDVIARSIGALDERYAALILDIDSPGGGYDGIEGVRTMVEAADFPIYALIRERAMAAAALIALLADSTFGVQGSRIGASVLPRADVDQMELVTELYSSIAVRRGIPREIGQAFVDTAVALPGIVEAGSLLQLTTAMGVQIGLVEGVVGGELELLDKIGLAGAEFDDVRLASASTIVVENRNWRDARVFLVLSGARFRLGNVTSMNSRRFRIDQPLRNGIRIEVLAEFVGSRERLQTDAILVEDGLLVEWSLENVLSNSSIFVTYSR